MLAVLQSGPYHFIITRIFVTGHKLQLPPAQTGMAKTWHLEGAAQCGALPHPCVWEHLLSVPISWQAETPRLKQGLRSWK